MPPAETQTPEHARIAVLGGVYSNYLALEAALRDARLRGVEACYCLGDLGAFGPHPDRTFPLLHEYDVQCIQGNYDNSIGNDLADCQCGYTDPRDNHFARVSYAYTLARTSPANRTWMRELPAQRHLRLGRYRVLLCHGSPRRMNEFLWESTTPTHFLEFLAGAHTADVILATHTGIKWHRRLGRDRHFVNVGVVGRPENDGRTNVWYTLLEATPDFRVEFIPVAYDHQRLAREMRQEKLPEEFVETVLTGWWTTCLEVLPARERRRGAFQTMTNLPVLVTGGAGFIGSHLVNLLLDQGRRVRVLERPGARVNHLPLDRVELVRADIRDRRAVVRAVRGCGDVYHLAANPQLWTRMRGHFRQVNHLGAVNVLEASLAAGVARVLHTSTESILSRARQTGPIVEDQCVTMRDVIGPYCRSKFLAERHALRLGRAGAPVVVVNPTLPVGPGDWGRSPPTQLVLDFCRGKRREYLDADLNLIDVRDVALGMARAMERGRPGRRYLLGHENLSIRNLFLLLARLTGLPEPRWRVPYPLALTAAYLSEWWADVVSHETPAATVTGVKLTRRRMHFDASRSLEELGLRPRPVAESLAETIAWFRRQGWTRPAS